MPFKRVFLFRCCKIWLRYPSLSLFLFLLLVSFVDGFVVCYLHDGGLCRLLGGGALQSCIRREEFDATFDYAVCCILLLRCFPY